MIITYNEKSKKFFKNSIIIITLVLLIFLIWLVILKYEVEGEEIESLPFKISEMKLASKVNAVKNEDNENVWNLTPMQINDIYIKIDANNEQKIESVKIQDIEIESNEVGTRKITKLNNYEMDNMEEVEFIGKNVTNLNNMTISEKGGTIGFSYVIQNLGTYISNESQIKYDMELLEKIGISKEQLKTKISFNIVIQSNGISYATKMEIELPTKEQQIESVDLSKIIFKRILQN